MLSTTPDPDSIDMAAAEAARFRLAIAAESLTRWYPPSQALEQIRQLGVVDVQLCSSLFPSVLDFTEREAVDLARSMRDLGLRGESISTFPYKVDAVRYVDFLRRLIDVAPVLGIRVINTYLLPFLYTSSDPQWVIANFARAMMPLLDRASHAGLVFTVEPEYYEITRDVTGLRQLLATVNHRCLKLTYDPCNLYQGNEEAFPYAYEELREHIAHVHLKNGSVFVIRPMKKPSPLPRRVRIASCAGGPWKTVR
jgi:sugar phosphate isomerase/epimerase